jgi:hypothetical protein
MFVSMLVAGGSDQDRYGAIVDMDGTLKLKLAENKLQELNT